MGMLDALIYGVRNLFAGGSALSLTSDLNFGDGLTAAYNATAQRVDVSINRSTSQSQLGAASSVNGVVPFRRGPLPPQSTFNDAAAHTLFTETIPTPSTVTLVTGIHGWIYSDAGAIIAAVYYGDFWGYTNLSGTPVLRSASGDGGWSYGPGAGITTLTGTTISGPTVSFQVALAIPSWTVTHVYSALDIVTSSGATYQTSNGGTAANAPSGAGSTGADGVIWVRVSTATTLKVVWTVTDRQVETATT